jgi:hypothetical protein
MRGVAYNTNKKEERERESLFMKNEKCFKHIDKKKRKR